MWAAKTYLEILGTSFVIRSTEQEQVEQVRALLAPFVTDRTVVPSRRRYHLVAASRIRPAFVGEDVMAFRDCRRLGPGGTLEDALARLVASLNRTAIDGYGGFAVHAGVVAHHGFGVAFPCGSGGGKSTLVAACLKTGFDYVSDEALCIDTDFGKVIPYPKPISLNDQSLDLLDLGIWAPTGASERLLSPSDLQATTIGGTIPLRHVVAAEFGHDGTHLREEAASESVVELLRYSFNHFKLGEQAFHAATSLASRVRMWRLAYNNPVQAAARLKEQLD